MHALSQSAQEFFAPKFDMRQVFLSYYPERRRTIFKNEGGRSWFTLNSDYPLQDELLLEAVSGQTKYFRGLRWGEFTRFIVLDVDTTGSYHDTAGLTLIRDALKAIDLKDLRLYRSGVSGGWHIYVPLETWEKSTEVTGFLKSYLRALKFDLRSGHLEVFPSGAGLRLPLQAGFAWLNPDATVAVERASMSSVQAIQRFVRDIESGTNSWTYTKSRITEFLEQLDSQRPAEENKIAADADMDGFDDLFEHKVLAENYERGKKFWRDGLTQSGERHRAVICVEHYLWHGDSEIGLPAYPGRFNDAARAEQILNWLRVGHNGFCNHINRGDWRVVEDQVRRACSWRAEYIPERQPYVLTSERAIERMVSLTKYSTRTWTPRDWQKGNEKRRTKARQKIEDAVNYFLSEGFQITKGAICERTGCSPNTVKKHGDLWRHLAFGSGDLEPGFRPGPGVLGEDLETGIEDFVSLIQEQVAPVVDEMQDFPASTRTGEASFLVPGTCFEDLREVFEVPGEKIETLILPFEAVENSGPLSLPVGGKKRRSRGKREGDAWNGQLVIDFGVFTDRALDRKRGPPTK